jgi:hypothetical protein
MYVCMWFICAAALRHFCMFVCTYMCDFSSQSLSFSFELVRQETKQFSCSLMFAFHMKFSQRLYFDQELHRVVAAQRNRRTDIPKTRKTGAIRCVLIVGL